MSPNASDERVRPKKITQRHLEWLSVDWPSLLDLIPMSRQKALVQQSHQGKWYVYVLWRDDLGRPIPFYVGKGTGRRATQHTAPSDQANRYKSALVSSLKRHKRPVRYSFVASYAEEADALAHEMELISLIGRAQYKAGPLANRTDGGDGARGHFARSGGDSASARPVIAEEIRYACLNDAAAEHAVSPGAVAQRIARGWPGYYYEDEGQRPASEGILGRYQRAVKVPIGVFPSLAEADRATGESVKSIFKRINAGWEDYYYIDEGQKPRATHNKKCLIRGVEYQSHTIAAQSLNVTKSVVAVRLKSSNYPKWIDLSGTIEKVQKGKVKARPVTVRGKSYPTAAAAERATGIAAGTILARARSTVDPDFSAEGIIPKKRNAALAKNNVGVCIGDTRFPSLSAAARAHSIDVATLKRRCQSPAFPKYRSDDPTLQIRAPKDGRASLIGIEISGVTYRSINAAYKVTGEARSKIRQKLDDPDYPYYRRP